MAKTSKSRKRPVLPVVFTGVQQIILSQFPYINDVLDGLKANVFITGGARGIDEYVALRMAEERPVSKGNRHIMVIPWNYRYKNDVLYVGFQNRLGGEIWDMPRPTRKSDVPEILRNDFMLDLALDLNPSKAFVCAFPGSREEILRSGTWTTIRHARKRNIPVKLNPLSEAGGSMREGKIEH